jgi:pilus assembly protein Flp/PilA
MRSFCQYVRDFLKREDGPTAVEYAVMLGLIITVCVGAVQALGSNASASFDNVNTTLVAGS